MTALPSRIEPPPPLIRLLTAEQVTLLILHLMATKAVQSRSEKTRARLTDVTMRRLTGRTRISEEFLSEVQEYLLRAGWALFWAGSSYAIIKVSAIEGWARVSSKRIADDLRKVARSEFDFGQLTHLLSAGDEAVDDDDEPGSE